MEDWELGLINTDDLVAGEPINDQINRLTHIWVFQRFFICLLGWNDE